MEPPQLVQTELTQFLTSQEFEEQLRKQVQLAVDKALAPEPTRGSIVYDKLNKQNDIENKYMHKVVVIDVKTEQIVVVADTIQEAYEVARSKTKSRNLYYRRVGRDYLYRV
jgi:hypothetical protein